MIIDNIVKKIKNSEIIQNILTLSFGSVVSQLIPIFVSLILARLYSPDDYGVWGVFSSYSSILLVFACGRYDLAILRPKRNIDALNIAYLSSIIAIILCVFIFFILLIADLFKFTAICSINGRYWLPVNVFIGALVLICTSYANRSERYRLIAKSSIFQSIVQATSRILFGISNFFSNGLIIGATMGGTVAFFYFHKNLKVFNLNCIKRSLSIKRIKELAVIYKNFFLYEMPSGLLNTMSTGIPIILMSYLFSKYYVGQFSMALHLLFLPISFIGTAMGNIFYKKACIWDNEKTAAFAFNILKFSYWTGIIPFLLLIFFGDELFSIVLGSKWQMAGIFSIYLSLWLWVTFCFSPLSTIYMAIDKQKMSMIVNSVNFFGRISAIIIGKYLIDSIFFTIFLYGVFNLLLWVLNGCIIWKYINIQMKILDKLLISSSFFIVLIIWIIKIYKLNLI
ncbi:MAG: oligosaccharide flippase family protein [Fusobacteriaceae bacterium]|nr:oligosaccharide flippase family protein [Fusobacteriaceae bacterium]